MKPVTLRINTQSKNTLVFHFRHQADLETAEVQLKDNRERIDFLKNAMPEEENKDHSVLQEELNGKGSELYVNIDKIREFQALWDQILK